MGKYQLCSHGCQTWKGQTGQYFKDEPTFTADREKVQMLVDELYDQELKPDVKQSKANLWDLLVLKTCWRCACFHSLWSRRRRAALFGPFHRQPPQFHLLLLLQLIHNQSHLCHSCTPHIAWVKTCTCPSFVMLLWNSAEWSRHWSETLCKCEMWS